MDVPSSPSSSSEYSVSDDDANNDANASFGPWASLIVDEINGQLGHEFDDAQDVETILGVDVDVEKVGPLDGHQNIEHEKPSQPLVNPDTLSQVLRIVTQQAIALDACRSELDTFRRESSEIMREKDEKVNSIRREVMMLRKEGDKRELESARSKAASSKVEDTITSLQRRYEQNLAHVEGEKAELVLQISAMRIANAQLKNRLDERGGGMEDLFGGLDEDMLNIKLTTIVKKSCLDLIEESETLRQSLAEAEALARDLEYTASVRQGRLEETEQTLEENVIRVEELETSISDLQARASESESVLSGLRSDLAASDEERVSLQKKLSTVEDNSLQFQELQSTVENLRGDAKTREDEYEKTLQELRKSLTDQETELKTSQSESEARKQELDDSRQRVLDLERDATTWKEKYEAEQGTSGKLRSEILEVQTACDAANTKCENYKNEIAVLQESLKSEKGSHVRTQAKLEDVTNDASKVSQELNEKLLVATSRCLDLESQHAATQSKIIDLEKVVSASQKELDEMKTSLNDTRQERDVALLNADQLRALVKEATENAKKVSSDLEASEKSVRDLESGRSKDLKVVEDLRKEIESHDVEMRKAEASLADEKKRSQEAADRRAEVMKDLDDLKLSLEKLNVQLLEANRANEKLQQDDGARTILLTDLENEVAQLKQLDEDKNVQYSKLVKDLEHCKGELAEYRVQATHQAKEAENKVSKLEAKLAEAEDVNDELGEALVDSRRQCRGAEAQLAELQEHLIVSDRLNNELILSQNKVKTELTRAQAHIEKLEAARVKMASIYGFQITQSPLPSPDRAHPMRRLSSASHTPTASPPTATSSLSRVSPDQGLPPNKRARLSSAVTRSSTLNSEGTEKDEVSPTAMLPPRSTLSSSGGGRTAAGPSTVKSEEDPLDVDGSVIGSASKDSAGNLQIPVVTTAVTTPVIQFQSGPTDPAAQAESLKEADPEEAEQQGSQAASRMTKPSKRILPHRQARRSSQPITSKALKVENDDETNPLPSTSKSANDHVVKKPLRKRKLSPLSQEPTVSDFSENLKKESESLITSQQDTYTAQDTSSQKSETPAPELTETYSLQYGPPTASARALYELFARICTWAYKDKDPKCALCMLEGSHDDRKPSSHVEFNALSDTVKFWHHCHEAHAAYWRPDLQNVLHGPQGLVRSVTGLPTSENLSSSTRDDKLREIVACFTKLSAWVSKDGEFVCGLCELENTHTDRPPFPKLTFDPHRQPDLFWNHCRTAHTFFWKPEVRNSVEVIPSFLRS